MHKGRVSAPPYTTTANVTSKCRGVCRVGQAFCTVLYFPTSARTISPGHSTSAQEVVGKHRDAKNKGLPFTAI
eukprot:1154305-Pelagomonas_calceolata.AAC.4